MTSPKVPYHDVPDLKRGLSETDSDLLQHRRNEARQMGELNIGEGMAQLPSMPVRISETKNREMGPSPLLEGALHLTGDFR
jgi:hypothetical protein